ncbi:MAG: hypothetical protein HY720_14410 [Planctomycetes bacterium]|nr:hypothetical protein [Planctomycetota bacterium]
MIPFRPVGLLVFLASASMLVPSAWSFEIMPSGSYSFYPQSAGLPSETWIVQSYSFETGGAYPDILTVRCYGLRAPTYFLQFESMYPILHADEYSIFGSTPRVEGYQWLQEIDAASAGLLVVVGRTNGAPATQYGPAVAAGNVVVRPATSMEAPGFGGLRFGVLAGANHPNGTVLGSLPTSSEPAAPSGESIADPTAVEVDFFFFVAVEDPALASETPIEESIAEPAPETIDSGTGGGPLSGGFSLEPTSDEAAPTEPLTEEELSTLVLDESGDLAMALGSALANLPDTPVLLILGQDQAARNIRAAIPQLLADPSMRGYSHVVVHGGTDGTLAWKPYSRLSPAPDLYVDITPQEIAKLLRGQGYRRGPVMLWACHGGSAPSSGGRAAADVLARELRTTAMGYDDLVHAFPPPAVPFSGGNLRVFKGAPRFGAKAAGHVLQIGGLALSAAHVASAPENERSRVLFGEVGSTAGSALGAMIAGKIAGAILGAKLGAAAGAGSTAGTGPGIAIGIGEGVVVGGIVGGVAGEATMVRAHDAIQSVPMSPIEGTPSAFPAVRALDARGRIRNEE